MPKTFWKTGLQICWQSYAIIILSIVLAILTNYFRTDQKISIFENWSSERQLLKESSKNIIISFETAKNLFFSNQAIFLDARSASEYKMGHIKGAYSFPLGKFDEYIGSILQKLPEDKIIITYCDGENCDLSKDLANELINMGYKKIRVLINGWSVWSENKLPIEKQ